MPADPAEPGPLTILTREGETTSSRDDALVDEIDGLGRAGASRTRSPCSQAGRRHLGLLGKRVGIEVPAYYLHPHHYVQLKDFSGSALVAEPTDLIHDLKLVKSPAEMAYIRKAAGSPTPPWRCSPARSPKAKASWRWRARSTTSCWRAGSGLAASPINLVSGERSGFSHGAPTARAIRRGDFGNIEYGSAYRALHSHDRPAVQRRRADAAHAGALRHRPPRLPTPASPTFATACRRWFRTKRRAG